MNQQRSSSARPGYGGANNDQNDAVRLLHDAEETMGGLDSLLIEANRLAQTIAAGLHGRRRAGPGETFWQHRPYAFGDAASSIDWRQSARGSARLYVRQSEWEAAATAMIWSDPSASMSFSSAPRFPTKRWRADVLATALSVLLARGGERIGLIGGRPMPYHGRSAPTQIAEALIDRKVDTNSDGASTPTMGHVAPGSAIILIGDFYEDIEKLSDAVASFADQGASGCLIQIVDPSEESFPFNGRTTFEDVESHRKRTIGDASSIRADYLKAFEEHRLSLSSLAKAVGWFFTAHSTDAPANEALFAAYTSLVEGAGSLAG
ncbi:MAG: DUF58 domain-containing protein [Pseudomonadota bacterium]